MRIRTTVTYEYDVVPEDFPENQRTPTQMAKMNLDIDNIATLEYADNFTVTAVEVRSENIGVGCTNCGCRWAEKCDPDQWCYNCRTLKESR